MVLSLWGVMHSYVICVTLFLLVPPDARKICELRTGTKTAKNHPSRGRRIRLSCVLLTTTSVQRLFS